MVFRLWIKEALKEKSITMGKLSRGADVPVSTVRRMVNDTSQNPTVATLAKASQYLGVSMDDLWYDDEKDASGERNKPELCLRLAPCDVNAESTF